MKNLKISNNMKILVLAGTIFIISKAFITSNVSDDSLVYKQYRYLPKEYVSFLEENNLVPFDSSMKSNILKGDFIEAMTSEAYLDDDGTLKFKDDWKLLSEEEKNRFFGIGRCSDIAFINLYQVKKIDGKIKQVKVKDNALKVNENYYIDADDSLVLKDPVFYSFKDGKKVKKLVK